MTETSNVIAQFYNEEGVASGPALSLPVDVNPEQLALLLNSLLGNVCFLSLLPHCSCN
jgi:ribosome assembly protein 4